MTIAALHLGWMRVLSAHLIAALVLVLGAQGHCLARCAGQVDEAATPPCHQQESSKQPVPCQYAFLVAEDRAPASIKVQPGDTAALECPLAIAVERPLDVTRQLLNWVADPPWMLESDPLTVLRV